MKMSPHSGNCRGRDRTERCSICKSLSVPKNFGARLRLASQMTAGRGKRQRQTPVMAYSETGESISFGPTVPPSFLRTGSGLKYVGTSATTGFVSTHRILKMERTPTIFVMPWNVVRHATKIQAKRIVTVATRLMGTIFTFIQTALGYVAPVIGFSTSNATVGSNTPEPWEAP